MIALILTAGAYEVRTSPNPGNSTTYHLERFSLTAVQRATITEAMEAWDAGSGQVLRGAEWTVNVNTLSQSQVGGINNCRDEVYARSDGVLGLIGAGGAIAVTVNRPCDDDVILNTDFDWCETGGPHVPGCRGNATPPSLPEKVSLGQVMLHEMGHVIAFDHEDDVLATMNTFYPAGGDLADNPEWLIQEDDAAGLTFVKPGSSTGRNFSVSEWRHDFGHTDGASAKILFEGPQASPYHIWDLSRGKFDTGFGPGKANLVYHGTGSATAEVEWRLSTNKICTSSDYLVGTRSPTMSQNTPYAVHPSGGYDLTGVPVGFYYLCVRIDPDDNVSETLETDNQFVTNYASIKVEP